MRGKAGDPGEAVLQDPDPGSVAEYVVLVLSVTFKADDHVR